MANTKTRQFPRLEPCEIGKQIDGILGDDRKRRVARRRALAARLNVTDQYLHFLAIGEVDFKGKLMTPGDALAAKFRTVVAELGGLRKAGAALDVEAFTAALTSAPTTAQDAPKAAKPQAKASKAAKARTNAQSGAKTAKKAARKRRGTRKGETTLRKMQRTRSLG
jgi:ribosome-binding protein aMBF1 (putative translation factor)